MAASFRRPWECFSSGRIVPLDKVRVAHARDLVALGDSVTCPNLVTRAGPAAIRPLRTTPSSPATPSRRSSPAGQQVQVPLKQPPYQLPPPLLQLFLQVSVVQSRRLPREPFLRLRELLPRSRESLIAHAGAYPCIGSFLCDPSSDNQTVTRGAL